MHITVLGIDPALRKTGYGVIQNSSEGNIFIDCGIMTTSPSHSFAQRLGEIFQGISELIDTYSPDHIAIEKIFLNTNPQSTIVLAHARGACISSAAFKNKKVYEYTALQIKKSVVGHGHAQKKQVQFMVSHLLRIPGLPSTDAADALACALCHISHWNY